MVSVRNGPAAIQSPETPPIVARRATSQQWGQIHPTVAQIVHKGCFNTIERPQEIFAKETSYMAATMACTDAMARAPDAREVAKIAKDNRPVGL